MSNLVFVDDLPVVRPVKVNRHTQHTLYGWDGSAWDLCNGAVKLTPGVIGLDEPPGAHWWDDPAAVEGSLLRGYRTSRRDCLLPVEISARTATEWMATYTRLSRILDPLRPCVWEVTPWQGETRRLAMYFTGGSLTRDIDPGVSRYEVLPLTFAAPQPYWTGKRVELGPWSEAAEGELAALDGPGVRNISKSATTASATITNPGDVHGRPIYTAEAPFTSFRVGLGADVIALNLAKATGYVTVDNRLGKLRAVDETGARLNESLSASSWHAIPPGESMQLNIEIIGGGSIRVEMDTLYRRAMAVPL